MFSSLWNTRLMGHFWLLLQLYGGVYNLFRSGLPRMGIDVTMVDIFDLNDLKKCLRSQTKLVWLEACTNPLVMLVDLGWDHLLSFWRFVAPVYKSTTEIWSFCKYFNQWQHSLAILTAMLYYYWLNQKLKHLCRRIKLHSCAVGWRNAGKKSNVLDFRGHHQSCQGVQCGDHCWHWQHFSLALHSGMLDQTKGDRM